MLTDIPINSSAWKAFNKGKTPATTPLPEKLAQYLKPSADKLILDVGCGWGRVSVYLYLQGFSVIGTDINSKEVDKATQDCQNIIDSNELHKLIFQVDDSSKHINIANGLADVVILNGVLLAMVKPEERTGLISEVRRVLKPGGILYIAEFGQTSDEQYKVDYRKHALITGEIGTIVSFEDKTVNFKNKTNQEISNLVKTNKIEYYAHHYTEKELKELLSEFNIIEFNKEKFITRSGKKINGFTIYAN